MLCLQLRDIAVAQLFLPFWVSCPPLGHLPRQLPSQRPQAQPCPLSLSLTAELTALVTRKLLSLELSAELSQCLVPAPRWAVYLASNELVGLLQLPCCHHLQHHIFEPHHQGNHSKAFGQSGIGMSFSGIYVSPSKSVKLVETSTSRYMMVMNWRSQFTQQSHAGWDAGSSAKHSCC